VGSARPLEVLLLSWRDRSHPLGGGAEVFAETVAEGLARRGHHVTVFCAAYEGAPTESRTPAGVRIVRAGGRLGVYPTAALRFLRHRLGDPDVIVDVQNGLPFLARLWSRTPTVLLCHHVHREQWPVVMGPVSARLGWFVESRISPLVHRGTAYVTVSESTARELVALGVRPEDVTVVHNGMPEAVDVSAERTAGPSLLVLGRLVPHKRVELALDVTARLREELPDLHLTVAGRGWWEEPLRRHAASLGLGSDTVDFTGYVDEEAKHRLLGAAWVSLVPSIKEGWGLSVVEAAVHGTPSVAFRAAGGVAESVIDGVTGLLADDEDGYAAAVRSLLVDDAFRERLGRQAREHAATWTWAAAVDRMEEVLLRVSASR
jgi:glycosyltransferase involved in cell wall biosynthesis